MLSPEQVKLIAQLEKHPKLLERIQKLLLVVDGDDNDNHDIKLADDAEDAVVDNLREFGKELLTEWGQQQEKRVCNNFKQVNPELKSHSKKNSNGTQHTEK
jgi:hypothetical protein